MSIPNPIVVPLTVSTNEVVVPMGVSDDSEQIALGVSYVIISGLSEHYAGAYEFTPGDETQTILIKDMVADDNIIINPIPSNYGKITWKGIGIHIS